jgi:raffinose synthase
MQRIKTEILLLPTSRLKKLRKCLPAKSKLYWCVPCWGSSETQVPIETVALLFEIRQDDTTNSIDGSGATSSSPPTYGLLLPLISNQGTFKGSLRPVRAGSTLGASNPDAIAVRMESGDDSVVSSTFDNTIYLATGNDPFELMERGVPAAASLSGTARPRGVKEVPEILDGFGWCTWDAFCEFLS